MRGPDRSNSGLTRIALLIAILISSVLISVQRGDDTRASRVEVASQETAAPLARLEDRSTAFTENETLREELAILRERQTRYDNLAHKVARYEAILGVDTETDVPLKKIAARAIGESNGPFVRSLLLNVGSKDGVKIGNPVLSTQGLIGHVINTLSRQGQRQQLFWRGIIQLSRNYHLSISEKIGQLVIVSFLLEMMVPYPEG